MKRISVDQADIGHRIWQTIIQSGCAVNVTLDGVPQAHVLVADEDEGYIVRQGADPVGDIRSGKWPVETVRGGKEGEAMMRDFEHFVNLERVVWPMQDGTIYWFGVGDYVRNKARTETGVIVAIDRGYAWLHVSDKKRVSIALSDLESAPKPLAVGDRVRLKDFSQNQYEIRMIEGGFAFLKNLTNTGSYGFNNLDGLERA